MNDEIIEYLELEIQMRKDGISTMVNSVHRDRLQKEIEKLNSWIKHLSNEDNEAFCEAALSDNLDFTRCKHWNNQPRGCLGCRRKFLTIM